jgi:hypothetical protein
MQLPHLLSDFFLLAACLYVFLLHIKPLPLANELLWEAFVLSVATAAAFGVLRFLGLDWARPVSAVFQQLAMVTGAVGLLAGVYALVVGKQFSFGQSGLVLGLGFALLLAQLGLKQAMLLGQLIPNIAMAGICLLGLYAIVKGKRAVGLWLLLALAFFASGQFSGQLYGPTEQSIDLFHYFTAGGVLCLGLAIARGKAQPAQ